MAEIGPDYRGGFVGQQVESSGGGWDPNQNNGNPLYKLYNNSTYDFNSRFYPRNLGSDTRGHYINFYVNMANNSMYNERPEYKSISTLGRTQSNQARGGTITSYNLSDIVTSANEILPKDMMIDDVQFGKDVSLSRRTKRITQAISLYMPETMNIQYNSDWQSTSLTDAGGLALKFGQAAKGVADNWKGYNMETARSLASNKATQALAAEIFGDLGQKAGILGDGATDFLMYATGSALNPQLEVLFKGVDFRKFQFDFMFAPYSEEEAKNVIDIIKVFKFHMAPEINKGMMGRYFVPPSEFDIDFLYGGQINNNIHQVGTCVLTNITVDYAPNGWSTFGGKDISSGGIPTHIRMTLEFMETEIVTKQRVEEGY